MKSVGLRRFFILSRRQTERIVEAMRRIQGTDRVEKMDEDGSAEFIPASPG